MMMRPWVWLQEAVAWANRRRGAQEAGSGWAAAAPVATTSPGHRTPSWGRGSLTEEQKGWATERWSLVPQLTRRLGQIRHGGSLPALQPPPHTRRPLLPGWEAPPSPWQACLCTFRTQPRCHLLRGAVPKHLHSALFFHCTLLDSSIAQPMYI